MISIESLFSNYLNHIKKYKSQGTYKSYQKDFVSLTKAFRYLGRCNFESVDTMIFEDLVDYYSSCTDKKNSKINDVLSSLVTVLNYHSLSYPKRYKLPDDTEHFRALSDSEWQQLRLYLEKIDVNVQNNLAYVLAIMLFLDTGARMSELLDIRFANVDFEEHCIYLEHTKNKKKRYAFFGNLSEDLLKQAKVRGSEYVLHNYMINKKLHYSSLYRFFNRINSEMKFESGRVHPHCLRKTFATKLMKKGLSLPVISKLLGHSDVRQTMIYLQIDRDLMKKGYEEFYPYE